MHRSTAMRFQNLRPLIVCSSIALVLPSCEMFRNDPNQAANPNDPYSQYGTGGAYGAQNPGAYGAPQTNPYGGYGAQTNPYGTTPGYTPPPAGGYTPPPYTQPADPYSGGGSYSPGGTGSYSGGAASGGRSGGRSHTVVRGDIGRRYGVGVSDLMRANNLESDLIREGQKLTIP